MVYSPFSLPRRLASLRPWRSGQAGWTGEGQDEVEKRW